MVVSSWGFPRWTRYKVSARGACPVARSFPATETAQITSAKVRTRNYEWTRYAMNECNEMGEETTKIMRFRQKTLQNWIRNAEWQFDTDKLRLRHQHKERRNRGVLKIERDFRVVPTGHRKISGKYQFILKFWNMNLFSLKWRSTTDFTISYTRKTIDKTNQTCEI